MISSGKSSASKGTSLFVVLFSSNLVYALFSLFFLHMYQIVLDEASKLFDKSRRRNTAFIVGMVGGYGAQEPKTHDHDVGISLFFIQQLMQMLQQIVCCANSGLRAFCCFALEMKIRVNIEKLTRLIKDLLKDGDRSNRYKGEYSCQGITYDCRGRGLKGTSPQACGLPVLVEGRPSPQGSRYRHS